MITSSIPRCDDLPRLAAPPEYYRDKPIYVGNEQPTGRVRNWAESRPGFEEIWLDREHNGWITLAFSEDAAARQSELEEQFPGVGVVAVQVDWKMAELEAIQQQVADVFGGSGDLSGTGIDITKGVVTIDFRILEPDLVREAEAHFATERVCVNGLDPALAPVEGPQPQSGYGWRLLADLDETGSPYRTGIAFDAASYAALWDEATGGGEPPAVNFETEVVVWFGAVHGSSCPRTRLDDVVADHDRAVVYSQLTYLDVGICTSDAIGHAYVVALERAKLPVGAFAIQLQSGDPPGANEERTIVEVDLSAPGSTAGPTEIHPDTSPRESNYATPGGIIETGYPWEYRQTAHCGLEWLGPLNHVSWRTDEADAADWIPDAWRDAIVDGEIRLELLMTTDPPKLEATANGHSVNYDATTQAPPGCD